MTYIASIARDWLDSHSGRSINDESRDPLLLIELLVESHPAWAWLIFLEVFEIDKEMISIDELVSGPFGSWINLHFAEWHETVEIEAADNKILRSALDRVYVGGLSRELGNHIKDIAGR